MVQQVICHPDNLELVRQLPEVKAIQCPADDPWSWFSLEFQTNSHMEKDRHSGRYILPDGSSVLKEDVVVQEKFEKYGPEDIWYLLWAGVIKEEREPLFYLLNTDNFRMFSMWEKPYVFKPSSLIKFGGC